MILENLRKAGVQNTRQGRAARLSTGSIPMPASGCTRRVNSPTPTARRGEWPSRIGPEHGTVGPQQVKEAAKEAVQGVGFDMLIVCGFAFDPHVAERSETLRQADVCCRPR